jgi:hypothetical protein
MQQSPTDGAFSAAQRAVSILVDEPDAPNAPLAAGAWATTVGEVLDDNLRDDDVAEVLRRVLDGSGPDCLDAGAAGLVRYRRAGSVR